MIENQSMSKYIYVFDIEKFKQWKMKYEDISIECMNIIIDNSNWIKLDGRERQELRDAGNPILLQWCRRVDTEKGE